MSNSSNVVNIFRRKVITNKLSNISQLLFLVFLSSCYGMYHRNTTVRKGAIPENFAKQKASVILIKPFEHSHVGNKMVKSFRFYRGNKIVISSDKSDELLRSTYSDKERYPYTITISRKTEWQYVSDTKGGGRMQAVVSYNYILLDRITGVSYMSATETSFYKALARAYAKNMEKVRKLNGGKVD